MASKTATPPSIIKIFADVKGRNVLVANIKRDLIIKHSKTVATLLEENPARTDVVIKDCSKGPLEHVIQFMVKGKQPLRIGVGHEPFPKKIAILQAVNALDVVPPQPQIENDVIYNITQFKITAEQVGVVEASSHRDGTGTRIYKAMVQAVAYNSLHEVFSAEEKKAIKEVANGAPDLNAAIGAKVVELKQRGEAHRERLAKKEAGRAAYEGRQARRQG